MVSPNIVELRPLRVEGQIERREQRSPRRLDTGSSNAVVGQIAELLEGVSVLLLVGPMPPVLLEARGHPRDLWNEDTEVDVSVTLEGATWPALTAASVSDTGDHPVNP
jgi:hypothetical protein